MKYPALPRKNIRTLMSILKILEIYSQNKKTKHNYFYSRKNPRILAESYAEQ